MANEENLVPMSQRTKEEVRELASRGGKKSGEVRRRKRDAKSAARLILNLPVQEAIEKNLKSMGLDKEEDYTNMVAIMARAFTKAMTGDISAMNFLIEMAGSSPKFKMEEELHNKTMQDGEKAGVVVDDWVAAVIEADEMEKKNGKK